MHCTKRSTPIKGKTDGSSNFELTWYNCYDLSSRSRAVSGHTILGKSTFSTARCPHLDEVISHLRLELLFEAESSTVYIIS